MSTTANRITASKGRVYVGPGCASSTIEGLRSKPPGVKRRQKRGRVHFDPSLNWSIEEEKSLRSSAARRERQHQKKMAGIVAMERQKSALQILKDPNKYGEITSLYNANVEPAQGLAGLEKHNLKVLLHVIIGYEEGETDFQQKFQQLQEPNLTYETLSDDQKVALEALSKNGLFAREFNRVLPSEPVADGSSSDDSNKKRSNKRRKWWKAQFEIDDKCEALNNGGPPSPTGPNEVMFDRLFD